MPLDQTWPSELPNNFLQAGYNEGNIDNIRETAMDVGPAKRRKKQTKAYKPITGTMIISTAQKAIFQAFFTGQSTSGVYANNIAYGSLPYTMPTYDSGTIDCYLNSHTIVPKSGGFWTLSLNIKTLV